MISKSKYIKALQCEKRLWLDKHAPELKDEVSAAQEALFRRGTSVGELAQKLFPQGKDASLMRDGKMIFPIWLGNTKKYVRDGTQVIFEAAFSAGGSFAAIDLLIREGEGWRAIEVKSSTSVKDYHINDAALQYHVLTSAGLDIVDIEIMYINNEYVRIAKLDLQKLFKSESVLDHILPLQREMPERIAHFKGILKQDDVPNIDIGLHCNDPFPCDFIGHCWKHIPENSVFDLSRIGAKAWEMYHNGIYDQNDIPEDFPLSDNNRIHLESQKTGQEHFDEKAVGDFLADWEFPLYFFDFETIGPAVPLFEGARPFMQIPFQYSLHILNEPGGDLIHKEFLPNPNGDPRQELAARLISDLGSSGSIITWNMSFEKGKIDDLITAYPESEIQLRAIYERIVDLMIPFRSMWFYNAKMKGSASIKNVLPALIPNFSYGELDISNGGDASETYLAMLENRFDGDYAKTMDDLREYCKMDTMAMVLIYRFLIDKIRNH